MKLGGLRSFCENVSRLQLTMNVIWRKKTSLNGIMKWQSISIYFILLWKTGLVAMWRAVWLLQYKEIGQGRGTRRSWSKWRYHFNSHKVIAIEQYSASVEDWETLCCSSSSKKQENHPKMQNILWQIDV